jgi:hypothetical protein
VFRPARGVLSFLIVIGALAMLWEVVKLLGGDPSERWTPPFQWTVANDLNMPHVWDIASSFVEPAQRNGPPLGLVGFGNEPELYAAMRKVGIDPTKRAT